MGAARRTTTEARKLAKRAGRRPTHGDKYAYKRVDEDTRAMNEKLAELAEHFNGGRA